MPKIVDARVQREEVLKATLEAIDRHGFEGTTIRRIAEQARVSTGFITHYFRDKDEVLAGAVRRGNERATQHLDRQLEGFHGLEGLRRLAECLMPQDEDQRLIWRVWLLFWGRPAAADDPLGRELRRAHAYWLKRTRGFLEEARQGGQLREHLDLRYEADRFLVLLSGLGLRQPGGGEGRPRYVEDHLASLVPEKP